jgi:predicted SAM-dependent methyltransferase
MTKFRCIDLKVRQIKMINLSKNMEFLQRIILSVTQKPRRIVECYLSSNEVKKLHIGCGGNFLEGWLNTDSIPASNKIIFMDATQKLPFDDNRFDYIFSEHMIEHITYTQGCLMLSECFRVLKSGGKLRISTPNLQFLIDLYTENKTEIQLEFIKHSSDRWIEKSPHYKNAPSFDETFVINNYMRAWGHQFIYDERVLRGLLEKVGFVKIHRVNVCESQDRCLENLENVSRKPPGLIALESLVVDCTKP